MTTGTAQQVISITCEEEGEQTTFTLGKNSEAGIVEFIHKQYRGYTVMGTEGVSRVEEVTEVIEGTIQSIKVEGADDTTCSLGDVIEDDDAKHMIKAIEFTPAGVKVTSEKGASLTHLSDFPFEVEITY